LKNLTVLENSKIHIILLRAVATNREIGVNLNDLLYTHHNVTVPVLTMLILVLTAAAAFAAFFIRRMQRKATAVARTVAYSTTSLAEAQVNIRRMENIVEGLRLLELEALEALRTRIAPPLLPQSEPPWVHVAMLPPLPWPLPVDTHWGCHTRWQRPTCSASRPADRTPAQTSGTLPQAGVNQQEDDDGAAVRSNKRERKN
jgi:hypothetical protein